MGFNEKLWADTRILKSYKRDRILPLKDYNRIVCFGDSITNSTFNNTSNYHRYPTKLMQLISSDSDLTTKKGDNFIVNSTPTNLTGWTVSDATNVSVDATGLKLLMNATQRNPRAIIPWITDGLSPITFDTSKLYFLECEIDADNAVSQDLQLRILTCSAVNTNVIDTVTYQGTKQLTNGFLKVTAIIDPSVDFSVTAKRMGLQIWLNTASTDGYAYAKNFKLYELSKGVKVINKGVDGNDTSLGLARIQADVVDLAPDVSVIMFGTNDIRNGVTLKTWLNNLTSMANTCAQNNIIPIVMTIPPLGTNQANYNLVPAWNMALKDRISNLGFDVIDLDRALLHDLVYIDDDRHPTQAGYSIIAETVYKKLMGYAY